ncbi:uncharacterized protein LOC141800786 isoform X2 [Halichoeres trimaculatus]|uniref:uncharacterized protein LOC141800786 isoform X2 n=1 Tax=Halichoeres trimaculatus TaxID=147232 RepID=UPI003D9FAE35
MDETAAAPAVRQDGAGKKPLHEDLASGESMCTSAEDTAESIPVFCCQDCGEAFREEAAYTEHRQQHLQESTHLGKQIDGFHGSSVEPSELHSTMVERHGEAFQRQPGVQPNPGTTNPPSYECPECGKCYGVLGHFLNHQRSHKQASKSVFHDLEHLKKKSFQCESCGRSYSRASALDAHRRCHEEKLIKARSRSSGDAVQAEESTAEVKPEETQTELAPKKTFKCSCGKEFASSMALKTHQRFSHNSLCTREYPKEKPKKVCSGFHCSECDKMLSSQIALINHQRWHSNCSSDPSKKFTCELCGKVFLTLSFYYRHQRTVHNDEAPAKSFLHQVCQLQKKAFECKDCGLKFSRASALHSHELHHTDHFRETETGRRSLHPPQWNTPESETKGTEQEQRKPEDTVLFTSTAELNELKTNESDEDVECYGPGDFNVQVISASESEDEPVQDLNPDLELLCESDQEQRDDSETGPLPGRIFSKPEMDLKIVQIDFEQADGQCAPIERGAENNSTEERFDCPDCYRWFTSASSLRVHRMWHGIRKRRHQAQGKQVSYACTKCGLKFTNLMVYKNHLQLHLLAEEEAGKGEDKSPAAQLDSGAVNDGADKDEHTGSDAHPSTTSSSVETPEARNDGHWKRKTPRACSVCGKVYLYLNALLKHQCEHASPDPAGRYVQKEGKYECPVCGLGITRKARLRAHMRAHKVKLSLKCDECNITFKTEKSFKRHLELHKLKPFWCLSCSRGFSCKESLEKHLQDHDPKKFNCNVCTKSFRYRMQLMYHMNTHTGAKPYQCAVCWKGFAYPGNVISHQKKHHKHGFIKSAKHAKRLVMKKQKQIGASRRKIRAACISKLPKKGHWMEWRRGKKTWEDAELRESVQDKDDSPEQTEHNCKMAKPLGLAALRSEMFQPQKEQQNGQKETQDTIMYEDHKYWEWECCVCEMGFDGVAELHMHYMKHATGEVPIPHDDFRG